MGITANASGSRGNADGNDLTYTNTHVDAGNTLTLKSGSDSTLKGAVASGKHVVTDIGGDLNIQSLQDSSTYNSRNQSAGGSVTVGAGVSGSVNLSHSKIDNNYASVNQQSGIKAGDDGFQINVKGNTGLVGSVIESTDKAVHDGKNTLITATLTSSDIHNQSKYDAQSIGIGFGGKTGGDSSAGQSSDNGVHIAPPIAMNANGNNSSVTRSGISGAAISITNTDKQKQLTGLDATTTVASIKRDVATGKDTSGAIGNTFNPAEVQTSFAVTQALSQQVSTFIAIKAQQADQAKAALKVEQAKSQTQQDPSKIAQLTQQINDSVQWAPGGSYRQVLTAITAASSGNVTGGTNQLIQGAAVNYIQSLGAEQIKALAKDMGGEGSPAHTALHCTVFLHAPEQPPKAATATQQR